MRRILLAIALASATALPVASCSLGLDESLIDRVDGAVADTGPLDETGTPDANEGGPPPPPPSTDAGPCTKDDDCKTTDGCLEPRCDLPRKTCAFDVCRTAVCTSGKCDTTAKTCSAPKPYKFAAGSFPVGAGISGAVRNAFAVVYPYVFVTTTNGVLAFSAADPTAGSPTAVTVTGLGFIPGQMIASGSRVFFLGGNSGSPTTTRVQLAYLDVPSDPFQKKLTATTVLAGVNEPSGTPFALFPRAGDSAFLVDVAAPPPIYPTAKVEPPLVEPVSLTAGPVPSTNGNVPVGSSGTRLVMRRVDAANQVIFAFVNGAGDTPTNGGDVPAPALGPIVGPESIALSPDGAMLYLFSEFVAGGLPPPPPPTTKGVKASFLLADAASNFDVTATAAVEIATYAGIAAGTPVVGGSAMFDSKTALVTTADPANVPGLTNVQVLARAPLGLVAGKKAQIPLGPGALAAAASNGLGYVLASESATAATVYVFDPGCGP